MPARTVKVADKPSVHPNRMRRVVAAITLAVLAVGGKIAWDHYSKTIRNHPQYLVTTENIEISPPPDWLRRDIKRDVLQDSGLNGTLSLLDDRAQLHERLHQAFRFHPWIRTVERIELVPPTKVKVDLNYRAPIAAVQIESENQTPLLVIDSDMVRLPEMDLTEVEKLYLPRIRGITSRPLVGETWSDQRVAGAVQLISALGDAWSKLHFVDVIPSESPELNKQSRFYVFDLVATGGTRIVWGTAPGQEPLGEATFGQKLEVLKSFIAQNGPLNSTYTPKSINLRDLRHGPVIEQRTVKKDGVVGDESEIRK